MAVLFFLNLQSAMYSEFTDSSLAYEQKRTRNSTFFLCMIQYHAVLILQIGSIPWYCSAYTVKRAVKLLPIYILRERTVLLASSGGVVPKNDKDNRENIMGSTIWIVVQMYALRATMRSFLQEECRISALRSLV